MSTTRERIINAANRLFYQRGFAHTSFAHIAAAVAISRGNFYHHFRSKDDILDAVIQQRLTDTQTMLANWENNSDSPVDRIGNFIDLLLLNRQQIQRYGCPVGTLTTELAKLNHAALEQANGLFSVFRHWLHEQFTRLGRTDNADQLTMHLLARSQGIATMANALQDHQFIQQEVQQLHVWLAKQHQTRSSNPS